ncbi:SAM-dependent methyltransferase [Streptomyces acidicola]|uniref:SAM-dependent methyltransferase n=1 Tax=Streptomyces acidicola TaxID=2596892 RepID=A0A5N8X2V1_9ACTN|nr:SAM-dependent methyltransferase [Streptomyces acidicola]MPY53344.1 SAM-dependent methyltransferase [Streptomyces acidicola]
MSATELHAESHTESHSELHTHQPSIARMYDYYLGGRDNYAADRAAAGRAIAAFPAIMVIARTNRVWMHRATRFLAERGVRQFLDLGTGIPTSPNLHEIAQSVIPGSRVVYVDKDPVALAQSEHLLNGSPEGRTAFVQADLNDPASILAAPQLTETLDLERPVGLSLNALLHFFPDDQDPGPYAIVEHLLGALAPGSYLALSHVTTDFDPEGIGRAIDVYRSSGIPAQARGKAEVERFFADLELVPPGLEVPHRWNADGMAEETRIAADVTDAEVSTYVGLARKP